MSASCNKHSISKLRLGIVLVLMFTLMAGLAYHAFSSPHINFLRPSLSGQWIVHSNPPVISDAIFLHRFRLNSVPKDFMVRIFAMRRFEALVNGQLLLAEPLSSWKRGFRANLAPYLRHGENEIQIRVYGEKGPPALLVEGSKEVRSDNDWKIALGPKFSEFSDVAVALKSEAYMTGKRNWMATRARYPFFPAGLMLYCLFIVYALIPRQFKPWMQASGPRNNDNKLEEPDGDDYSMPLSGLSNLLRQHGFFLFLMAVVTAVQFHNVMNYPPDRGFDYAGHIEYVRHVAKHWNVPMPTDGWEMYHPPLYYFCSAIIYNIFGGVGSESTSLKAVQVFTMLTGLASIGLTWWMLCVLFPRQARLRNLGFSVAAMLPMGFYMNSLVSNEIFSGGTIGLAIFLAVRFGFGCTLSWRDALLIGSGCGLGLLSKYTGLFVFLSVVFLLFLRQVSHQETEYNDAHRSPTALLFSLRLPPVLLIAVTLSISGWLYARNLIHFGDPFIGNWGKSSDLSFNQHPGYRTLNFYTRFGSVFFHAPEHSRWGSFWDGEYASMWADSHGTFLHNNNGLTRFLESTILWLAFLPSVAILFGFGKAFWYLFRREWDHPFFILVLTSILSVVSIILFTMELPFYCSVKAFYLLSLISSIGVFAALGLETMCQQLGRLRWLLYGNLVTLYGFVLYLFWY